MKSIILFALGIVCGYVFANKRRQSDFESNQKEVNNLLSENEKIRKQATESTRRAEDLESELARLKSHSRNNEEKSDDLMDNLSDAMKNIKKLKAQISILESELSDWKAACGSKDAEIQQLKDALYK